jgi:hypothetical protein
LILAHPLPFVNTHAGVCQRKVNMSGLVIVRFSAKTCHDEDQNTAFAMDDRLGGYSCPSDGFYAYVRVEAFFFLFFQ